MGERARERKNFHLVHAVSMAHEDDKVDKDKPFFMSMCLRMATKQFIKNDGNRVFF